MLGQEDTVDGQRQGGVHVKERGNAALPTDIVKVLKTQDENYIRTMRSAGLKVRQRYYASSNPYSRL